MRMRYTWKIFKYSKLCVDDSSLLTECGKDLNILSQTIIHSQIDADSIKEERWIHVYTETNKTIEVTLGDYFEIKLLVSDFHCYKSFVLEKLELCQQMRWTAKGRSFACKYENNTKRFQISFYDKDEVAAFHRLFSQKINFEIIETNQYLSRKNFLERMKELNRGVEKEQKEQRLEFRVIREFKELKHEFLRMLYEQNTDTL